MTARCANKSKQTATHKQTATPPPKITWLSVDSIQPDVMDVGVEWTFSPPKFLHVPLGVAGWHLGYEKRRCWANCSRSYLPRFSIYVVIIHQCHRQTRQTDRQTDKRTDDILVDHHSSDYDITQYFVKTHLLTKVTNQPASRFLLFLFPR